MGIALSPAHAALTISAAATQNMHCSGGECVPTATSAVLNTSDLEGYLSQFGNVRVSTTGNGVEAGNIVVSAALSSPDSTSLALAALKAIRIEAAVAIGSNGAELELQSGTSGTLGNISFGLSQGSITFGSTSDLFDINGAAFTLVGTLPDLAAKANAEPGGFFALTGNYDASVDGTYKTSPIDVAFLGYFEALGNAISNLKINAQGEYVGLFADLTGNQGFGVVRNLRLQNALVKGNIADIGGIAGFIEQNGMVSQSSVTGAVKGNDSASAGGVAGLVNFGTLNASWSSAKVFVGNTYAEAGGLVGANGGTVQNCWATGTVSSGYQGTNTGGLAGYNSGSITGSFATGSALGNGGGGAGESNAGGLVGENDGTIENSYAEGQVSDTATGGAMSLGGLIGYDDMDDLTSASYATGNVRGGGSDEIGGVVGSIFRGKFSNTYWDTTTSGLSQGTGYGNDRGLTGLTSAALRSGLPKGFQGKVWTENANTNSGFPYLIKNPPPK